MVYRTLLFLALVVGSVSARRRWFGSSRESQCGSFMDARRLRVNVRQIQDDLNALDTNNDGFLTFAEMNNLEIASTIDSSLDLDTGIDRCTFVMSEMERYGMSMGVAGRLFDVYDVNNDLLISTADQDVATFNQLDSDGDGRVPVCDVYRDFIDKLKDVTMAAKIHERKYQQLD